MQLQTNKELNKKGRQLNRRKKTKRSKTPIRVAGFLIVAALIFGAVKGITMYNTLNKYSKLIYPKVYVNNVDVSDKTKEEALNLLATNYKNDNAKRNLVVSINDKKYTLPFDKLGIEYDFKNAVDKAFSYEKDKGAFEKYKAISKAKLMKVDLKYEYNSKEIDKLIKNIENENNVKPRDARLTRAGAGFSTVEGKSGLQVDTKAIKEEIKKSIDIDSKSDINIKGNLKKVEPKVSSAQLKPVNSLISTYSTSYGTSNQNRSTNIRISTNSINGQTVMPGETFSFNNTTGQRSPGNGYKKATVILNDEFVDGYGGGVCQVSTTLYNAILRANIMPKERAAHTIPSSYVPLGMDATVDYGNIDYKFKNTLPYPIYIEGAAGGGRLTFNIYSNKSLNSIKYDLAHVINGNRVSVYKIGFQNGKQISKVKVSTDVHNKK